MSGCLRSTWTTTLSHSTTSNTASWSHKWWVKGAPQTMPSSRSSPSSSSNSKSVFCQSIYIHVWTCNPDARISCNHNARGVINRIVIFSVTDWSYLIQCYREVTQFNSHYSYFLWFNSFFCWFHSYFLWFQMYGLINLIKLEEYFEPFELLVLILSAICHDLDHPGYNNAYQVK